MNAVAAISVIFMKITLIIYVTWIESILQTLIFYKHWYSLWKCVSTFILYFILILKNNDADHFVQYSFTVSQSDPIDRYGKSIETRVVGKVLFNYLIRRQIRKRIKLQVCDKSWVSFLATNFSFMHYCYWKVILVSIVTDSQAGSCQRRKIVQKTWKSFSGYSALFHFSSFSSLQFSSSLS